jgi:hypothetical protein
MISVTQMHLRLRHSHHTGQRHNGKDVPGLDHCGLRGAKESKGKSGRFESSVVVVMLPE